MSINEVFMPALSSTMTEGKIVSWVKSPGDKVEKGETVVVVESDKADMDVESFYEGYLAHVIVQAGETATVGAAIALLADTEAEIETAIAQAKSQVANPAPTTKVAPTPVAESAAPTSTSVSQNGSNHRQGRIIASPRARKLAKEFKVDLSNLSGSGPYGRIVAQDVEAVAGVSNNQPAAPASFPKVAVTTSVPSTPQATVTTTPVSSTVPGQIVPFNTLQQAVVRSMVATVSVPVFRVGYTITTDELDRLYKQIKPKGVTMTALLAKQYFNFNYW